MERRATARGAGSRRLTEKQTRSRRGRRTPEVLHRRRSCRLKREAASVGKEDFAAPDGKAASNSEERAESQTVDETPAPKDVAAVAVTDEEVSLEKNTASPTGNTKDALDEEVASTPVKVEAAGSEEKKTVLVLPEQDVDMQDKEATSPSSEEQASAAPAVSVEAKSGESLSGEQELASPDSSASTQRHRVDEAEGASTAHIFARSSPFAPAGEESSSNVRVGGLPSVAKPNISLG